MSSYATPALGQTPHYSLASQNRSAGVRQLGTTLVTGANGFIGSNLIRYLMADGVPTIAALRSGRQLPTELSHCGYLRTRELSNRSRELEDLLDGVDTLIHVAGRTAATNYREFLDANYSLTYRLLKAATRLSSPPRIILVSSVAASGPTGRNQSRHSADLPAPVSQYGRSKLMGEKAARHLADRLAISIVRPGIVFGPADREVFRLIKLIHAAHVNFLPGYRNPKFPFVAVEDLLSAIVQAARLGRPINRAGDLGRGVYFVANPEMLSFAEFGKAVSQAMQQRLFLNIPLPMWLVRIAALLSEKLSNPDTPATFNPDKIREATAASWACDVSPTIEELNWQPAPLHKRLCETLQWYQQRNLL